MRKQFHNIIGFFKQRIAEIKQLKDPSARFFSDAEVTTIEGPSRFGHIILWTAVVFFIVGLVWAKLAILDEVTVGDGKVIPSSQIQVIQNLEGGIVSKIFVHEGDIVQKDQVLMQLDTKRFASSYDEAMMKALSLKLKVARLTAEANDKPFIPPEDIQKTKPELVMSEMELYKSRQSELKQMKNSRLLAEKELEITKPLVKAGAASPVEVIRLERSLSDIDGQISNFYSRALSELSEARAELSTLHESTAGLQDRLQRTTILAPVKGIVKQIKVNTIGGVIQPGMDLLEIVPLNDNLLIEAKIRPADIGFLHPGQEAMVKISAYDFSIYGGLPGIVEQISADSISNEKGDSFYLIRVRTQKNYLKTPAKPLYIIPGMMASVDILTGRKSVLHYLLKPIIKAKELALRER